MSDFTLDKINTAKAAMKDAKLNGAGGEAPVLPDDENARALVLIDFAERYNAKLSAVKQARGVAKRKAK